MSLPKPPVPLDGDCSVLFNNTLYTYSANAFQSLKLTQGATWQQIPAKGESVTGGVCVGSTPADSSTAGFFVVGGTAASSNYTGLQKYTYSTGEWETITPEAFVTRNRLWHSATYINGTDSILVYAGSQDGVKGLSSATFTIGASAPFSVGSFTSTVVPPAVAPILVPWDASQVVMVGGDPGNLKVTLFDSRIKDPTAAWVDAGTTLAEPLLLNSTLVKAALITGDDNSKHLYTFDPSTTPTTVNRTVLLNGSGQPIPSSAPITSSAGKRDLSMADWPTYNATLAPKSTRTGYSLATDSNGLVVMSGGNENDVLCMFNGRQNCWNNATAALVSTKQVTDTVSISSSAVPTSTAAATAVISQSATSTPAAAAATPSGESSGLQVGAILGIVLGSIAGIALLLVLLLLLLKRRRQRQAHTEAGHNRRASGIPPEEKNVAFDVAQASGGHFRGHNSSESAGSYSSMAILMGKMQKAPIQRKASDRSSSTKRTSVSSILNRQFKSTIGRPQLQTTPEPDFMRRDEKTPAATTNMNASSSQPRPRPGPGPNRDGTTRRSSGWNRYWSGGSTLNILGFGGGAKRETTVSDQSSHYSDTYRMTQDSATVPPLAVEGRPEFFRVNSGSPRVAEHGKKIKDHMSASFERPVSGVSSSGYSSGIPPSVHENWDPSLAQKPWGADRAPSSAYSAAVEGPSSSRAPTGVSRQPQLAMASISTDMSWLNLGENR